MDFLIRSLAVHKEKGQEILCIREDALNVVDSFLISRYLWYSQIINDGTGYKFDLIAAKIFEYFLENGLAYSFEHLMDGVIESPNEYFTFNDSYFMAKLHEYLAGRIMHPMIRELSEMLARRIPPAQVKVAPLAPTLVESEDHRKSLVKQTQAAMDWLTAEIRNIDPEAWVVCDIPTRDVMFTQNADSLKRRYKTNKEALLARDPAKILTRHDEPRLLVEMQGSLMSILSQYRNFIPRVYLSPEVYEILKSKKVLDRMRQQDFAGA